jgi:putative SOS response-associated peptidase YedK
MCGRYTLRQTEQLPLRFEASATPDVRAALGPRFNIAPTQAVPIVTEARAGERAIELADWGLTPHRPGGKRYLAFNARAETLTERPLFRGLLPSSRCLIPGDGFIEWQKAGTGARPLLLRPGRRDDLRVRRVARPLARSGWRVAHRLHDHHDRAE